MTITKCLEKVQDFRKARGKIYSMVSVIKLIVAGLLYNKNNLKSIARFGQSLSRKERESLGFERGRVPCYSNLTIIIRKIVVESFKEIISELIAYIIRANKKVECKVLHIDGKVLRGSDSYGGNAQTQILSAFSSQIKAITGFEEIHNKDEYHAMIQLLSEHDIEDKIITADAAFCHESACEKAIERGGNFAFALKSNEANLYYYSSKEFDVLGNQGKEIRCFEEEVDLQHGRIEKRKIEVIDMPFDYLNGFRHIKQICRITREREQKSQPGSFSSETALMITSLGKEFNPQALLKLNRNHWCCENSLNWVKDEVFGEDKSTISTGKAPLVMSLLRSIAISVINTISDKITETREMFNNHRNKLFKLFAIRETDF